MKSRFFVTGTDTDVGKTIISLGLMHSLQDQGIATLGMKPVASGCKITDDGLRNDDALALQGQSSLPLTYEQVNHYAFEPAIAPYAAAAREGVEISIATLAKEFHKLSMLTPGTVVEGAGGWLVPLTRTTGIADLADAMALPVVLVVGIRLGCINHALLTANAIRGCGLELAGWVANHASPDLEDSGETIQSIKEHINCALLGSVPYLEPHQQTTPRVASYLTLSSFA